MRHGVPVSALFAIMLVLGVWSFHLFRNRDAAVIHRNFDAMLRAVEKDAPEGIVEAARHARSAGDHFATQITVRVSDSISFSGSRSEAVSALARARGAVETVSCTLHGRQLRIRPDRASAEMACALEWRVNGERSFDDYVLHWEKQEKDWKLARVAPSDVIRHPGATP